MRTPLLVYDVNRWAWHYRATDTAAAAPPGIDPTTMQASTFLAHVGDRGFWDRYDSLFFMSWAGCPIDRIRKSSCRRLVTLVTSAGPAFRALDGDDWRTWIVTGSRNFGNAHSKLPRFDAIITVNRFLYDACRKHTDGEVRMIPSGVNCELFRPAEQPQPEGRPFRVGWCANIKGTHTVKGHREILVPLMSERPEWDWQVNTNDRRSAWPREEMAAWYRTLDAFLCTSVIEGTPSPVFEAAASGVPIVSTDVGCVEDWPLPHELGLIASPYRNPVEAQATQNQLLDTLTGLSRLTADERRSLGLQLRADVEQRYSYEVIAPQYLEVICPES